MISKILCYVYFQFNKRMPLFMSIKYKCVLFNIYLYCKLMFRVNINLVFLCYNRTAPDL